jgi:hypothetical protein
MKMISQKMRREKKYQYRTKKELPVLGRDKIMKEENEDQKKLLCPKAGCFGR